MLSLLLPTIVGVRRILDNNRWLLVLVLALLLFRGLVEPVPSHARDAEDPGKSASYTVTQKCGGDSASPGCEMGERCGFHICTPAALIAPDTVLALRSPSASMPGRPAIFSVHIPGLPSRPPLAVRV